MQTTIVILLVVAILMIHRAGKIITLNQGVIANAIDEIKDELKKNKQ